MSKIIVLGNGYVGKKAYKYLFETIGSINDVVQLCNYKYNDPHSLRETLFKDLFSQFTSVQDKWIVNCVGYTGKPNVDACEVNKQICWDLNVTFPILLAQYCAQYNIKIINVSSGCIYDKVDSKTTPFTEEDFPNFGVDSSTSSWYSKTKHAAELSLQNYNNVYTLRIRMPVCNDFNSPKNYLCKILKYSDLLEETNSKTIIEDLLQVINKIINIEGFPGGVYNCVNPNPLPTSEVCKILEKNGMWNPHWKFIEYKQLKEQITANRSNCILSTERLKEHGLEMPSEQESLLRILNDK